MIVMIVVTVMVCFGLGCLGGLVTCIVCLFDGDVAVVANAEHAHLAVACKNKLSEQQNENAKVVHECVSYLISALMPAVT